MKRLIFAVAGLLMAIGLAGGAVHAAQESQPAVAGPVDLEYRLAPGDKVRVIVFGEDSLTGEYAVNSSGLLSFPLVGSIKAKDETVESLQASLTRALADGYLVDPKVNIQILNFRPFFILGEVNRPGNYPAATGMTLEQAVASAGGFTYRANTKKIYFKAATDTQERPINLKENGTLIIRAGDTVRVAERHF
jgi:protein involved in polysaccharide export with SLBB domain